MASCTPTEESDIYLDDFNSSETCFVTNELDNAFVRHQGGELTLESNGEGFTVWTTCDDLSPSEFMFEIDFQDRTEDPEFHYITFMIHTQLEFAEGSDEEVVEWEWYEISLGFGEGFVSAFCIGHGTRDTFESFTESLYDDSCWVDIPLDIVPSEWNHFALKRQGAVISLTINEVFVGAINDARLSDGGFGLAVGTFGGQSVAASFDNFKISPVQE